MDDSDQRTSRLDGQIGGQTGYPTAGRCADQPSRFGVIAIGGFTTDVEAPPVLILFSRTIRRSMPLPSAGERYAAGGTKDSRTNENGGAG